MPAARFASAPALVLVLAALTVPAHASPAGPSRDPGLEPAAPSVGAPAPASASASTPPSGSVLPPTAAPRGELEVPPETLHDPFAASLRDGRTVSGLSAVRALHFTFDDGPSEHTPALLDALEARGIRATFFLVARQLEHERGRRIARQIAARGHSIGLHSYRHDDLTTLDTAALRRDLDRSERAFEEVFEARPWLFRPPYGRHDERVDAELASRGYTQVLWNITTSDGHARSPDDVLAGFRAAMDRQERMPRGAGGIVVFHDTHRPVVEAMPAIFAEIDARNCALAADPGAELWDVHDDLSAWHEARGRAASTRSARRMRLGEEDFAERQARARERAAGTCTAGAT